jgi:hypothetical protein
MLIGFSTINHQAIWVPPLQAEEVAVVEVSAFSFKGKAIGWSVNTLISRSYP